MYSEETARLIDQEMKRIVEECFSEANSLLKDNRDRLDRLARALLEHDSLDEKEILEVTGLGAAKAPAAGGRSA
jgi:cell division protease FtsH